MATRRTIREAFYASIEDAVGDLMDVDNISDEYPSTDEELPTIVHRDDYRDVPINTNTGVVDHYTETDGTVVDLYSDVMEARFSTLVAAQSETTKEDIYEALRTHFERYEYPTADPRSLHEDISRIWVTDASSEDTETRDPPARGDRLQINFQFERFYTDENTPIETVNAGFDVADDQDQYDDQIDIETTTE